MSELTIPEALPLIHADHGVGDIHIYLAEQIARAAGEGLFIEVFDLPRNVVSLSSSLYGPTAGDDPIGEDEVVYERRGDRAGLSRLVDRPARPCSRMVVVGVGGASPILYTIYGTQAQEATPREWWDPTMTLPEGQAASKFWAEHALARE